MSGIRVPRCPRPHRATSDWFPGGKAVRGIRADRDAGHGVNHEPKFRCLRPGLTSAEFHASSIADSPRSRCPFVSGSFRLRCEVQVAYERPTAQTMQTARVCSGAAAVAPRVVRNAAYLVATVPRYPTRWPRAVAADRFATGREFACSPRKARDIAVIRGEPGLELARPTARLRHVRLHVAAFRVGLQQYPRPHQRRSCRVCACPARTRVLRGQSHRLRARRIPPCDACRTTSAGARTGARDSTARAIGPDHKARPC